MISAPLLLAVAMAQALDGPTPYRRAISAAVFELCPGRVPIDDATALGERGFHRVPAVEERIARAALPQGRAFVLAAGDQVNAVMIAYWPATHFCSLTFTGPEADGTMIGLEARLTSDRAVYLPLPNHAFRATLGDRTALITLRRPPVDDQSGSFTVTFETAN